MSSAPIPSREAERLAALRAYQILDSEPEREFDDLSRIASLVCETPIALVTFIDANRQWFKARIGVSDRETTRESAFCAHAIAAPDPMLVVPDASADPRFVANEHVTDGLGVRFYAGATIRTPEGDGLGTVCVIDTRPRDLNDTQREVLEALARQAASLLERRRVTQQLHDALAEVRSLSELLPICTYCQRIRDDEDYWADLNAYLREHAGTQLSHSICPDCMTTRFGDLLAPAKE